MLGESSEGLCARAFPDQGDTKLGQANTSKQIMRSDFVDI